MKRLFISDLHLDESRPWVVNAFSTFLKTRARQARELYILGDLFEAWIGDDDDGELATRVRTNMRDLAEAGVELYLMQGNRDFLLGSRFARETCCRMLADPSVIEVGGKPCVLSHGDALCTRDSEYMQLREVLRSRAWQDEILERSLDERRTLAREVREESRRAGANKADNIMDVTAEAVCQLMQEHRANLMIHGHTHRPAVHEFDLSGEPASRIVLGDWFHYAWVLELEGRQRALRRIPIPGRPS